MHFMTRLTGVATVADEVHGFSYFDNRDLLGFVDGTENPVDQAAVDATVIGDEDPAFAGGSYVIVQKYLHDLAGWNALPVETQERMVGRSKLSDIEMDESVKPSYAYTCLSDAPPRQLRPLARLQPGRHRHSFFRSFKQLAGRNQPGR